MRIQRPSVSRTPRSLFVSARTIAAAVLVQLVWLSNASAVDLLVTAASGQPYGVASIEIPVESTPGKGFAPLEVSDVSGRVLYPVADDVRVKVAPPSRRTVPQPGRGRLLNRVGNLIREMTNLGPGDVERTVARRVYFLFTGSEPIRIQLGDSQGEIGVYDIVPKADQAAHFETMREWWTSYTDATRRQIESADYPPWVENYLVAMLAGRADLPLPGWFTNVSDDDDQLLNTLKLVAGAEGASETAFRREAVGQSGPIPPASLPIPAPPQWLADNTPNLPDVPVEPMATRVPPECFYVRYGSFENYLWFLDLSNEYGGDISKMVSLRGVQNNTAKRIEDQLHVHSNELSRLLGPAVIDDQAIIGRDLFLNDGATIGVLFKAKNAFLLRTSLTTERNSLASADDTVTQETMEIAGKSVSFLSSSDNRIRSFLVEDGDFILVTNSQTLARRFIEVGKSGESLAVTASFQLARQLMPLTRNDTIFAYFSPAMLRGLVAPEYLIELRRRLYAKSDVAMVHLARLAAAQESGGSSAPYGIDELSQAGFLPRSFGVRPDGSGVISVGETVMDTLRGARGTFLPIADVQFDGVTAEESAWYGEIAEQYSTQFPSMDPIMIGLQRQAVEGAEGIERLSVHAEVAPWDPGKYGSLTKQLGPPTKVAIKFAPDDIVAVQAHVASPQIGPATHLFAAVKDSVPPEPEEFEGLLNTYFALRQIPGYLGAWPQPGALDRLPLGLGVGQPVGPGMSRLIGGLYRYTDGQFSVLSFQPDVMQASLPHLAAIDVDDTAQVRGRIGNLNGSRIEGWVNDQLYQRASESSLAGASFLSKLSKQLRVEPSLALNSAEQILGAKLQCTLGGQYTAGGDGRWTSTAWGGSQPPPHAPPEYVAPAMQWFRGSQATLTQLANRLVADAVIDIARK